MAQSRESDEDSGSFRSYVIEAGFKNTNCSIPRFSMTCVKGIANLHILEWEYSTSRFEFDIPRCDQRML